MGDELDGLKYISQIQRGLMDERRKYEFRILFLALSYYVALTATVLSGEVTVSAIVKIVIVILNLTLGAGVWWYLLSIHHANYRNKRLAEEAENAICKRIGISEKPLGPFAEWAPTSQSLILLVIVAGSTLIVWLYARPSGCF